jgi:hypothetical protein
MDPAHSTLVTSVASVAQRMMLFWFGIAVSIAVVLPFGVLEHYSTVPSFFSSLSWSMFQLDPSNNWFVLVEVPITGFFSIGLGTIVFLRSEAAIRGVVKDVTRSTLRFIEREVADLSIRLKELDEAHLKRLMELSALHNGVAKAGSYRSLIISGLSVLIPFIIPVASLYFRKQP